MIIVVTGTVGAGKSFFSDYLVSKGFNHYSASKYLSKILTEKNLPLTRINMIDLANEMRAHSPTYLTEKLLEMAEKGGGDSVIESARTVNEIKPIKDLENSYLIAIDTDPEIRFSRIKARGKVEDDLEFKDFLLNEKREFENENPNKQNLKACIAIADFKIWNNGTKEELVEKIDKILGEIGWSH